ncbi:MAG TPA: patatin-like phospholipase family protein [Pantanalinema sp.]
MGKVGLVLCGGVAKGAYEAGVLKAIAEHQIYPDAIVGISAGAINGTFAAQLIAAGQFTGQAVESELVHHWRETVNAQNLYQGFGRMDGDEMERRNLRTLFNRIGVDPLRRQYRPRIGFDSLFAFEQLIRGDFASLISHHFVRQIMEDYVRLPQVIKRPVKLSLVATDLMGSTSLSDAMELAARYSVYEDYVWSNEASHEDWEANVQPRLTRMIEASSSFPFLFPPTRDAQSGAMLFDGGLMDNAPIGRVIRMDPEIDTVLVVSGVTVVDRPEHEPDTLYGVLGRVFSMLAGRFVIQNYRKVRKENDKLERLHELLKRGRNGNVLQNAFNQTLAQAAGYKSLDDLLERRIVRLIPIFPKPSLPGDVFEGFFRPELREAYIQQGYRDASAALGREAWVSTDAGVADIPEEALIMARAFDHAFDA